MRTRGEATKVYAIPCSQPDASVADLKRSALERWSGDGGRLENQEGAADRFDLVLSGNGALLSDEDSICSVLKDGEFVDLRKLTMIISFSYENCFCFAYIIKISLLPCN